MTPAGVRRLWDEQGPVSAAQLPRTPQLLRVPPRTEGLCGSEQAGARGSPFVALYVAYYRYAAMALVFGAAHLDLIWLVSCF